MKMVWRAVRRLIQVSRPVGWAALATLYAAGALIGGAGVDSWMVWAGAVFFTLPAGVILFAPNDLADRASDTMNARKRADKGMVAGASETRLLTGAVVVCTALGVVVFAVGGRYMAAGMVLALGLFSYIYSVPPIRTKARPVFDSLTNGVWVLCALLAGYYVDTVGFTAQLPGWRTLLTLVLCVMAGHAWTAAVDYEADKTVGDRTIAVGLGKRGAIAFAVAAFAACFWVSHSLPVRVYVGYCLAAAAVSFAYPATRLMYWLAFAAVMAIPLLFIYVVVFGFQTF